jgi:hypothetical protein
MEANQFFMMPKNLTYFQMDLKSIFGTQNRFERNILSCTIEYKITEYWILVKTKNKQLTVIIIIRIYK